MFKGLYVYVSKDHINGWSRPLYKEIKGIGNVLEYLARGDKIFTKMKRNCGNS